MPSPSILSREEIYDNIIETLGNTPLVRLHHVTSEVKAEVLAKVEYFNPGGSVKDRIGMAIIEDAERAGRIKPGGTIIESTSGNTGVGLAIAAILKGYKCIFVMADKQSEEKRSLLRAFGARVVVCPTAVEPDDPRSYYSVANRLVAETPNSILANQYHNPINPLVHYENTGPEIWRQVGGKIDVFVATMGTGGTISGTGKYLKEQNPDIQIVGVDPVGSILYHYFKTGEMGEAHSYRVEGFGEDFVPTATDFSVVTDMVQVNDRESFHMARRLVREEGIFCGGSSGSAVAGALKYIQQAGLGEEKRVVVLLPDGGSRYLSKIFNDDWMREYGYFGQVRCPGTASDVLRVKGRHELITVKPDDRMNDVIGLMKQHSISQAPVMSEGHLVGIVREVDLLNHMLMSSHEHTPAETIAETVYSSVSSVGPEASIEDLMSLFTGGADVVMVLAGNGKGTPGILTKIDVLDYVATNCL
jgi:cystathionine beta-synthase